jgi:uncharacterized protein (TIGR00297 family)
MLLRWQSRLILLLALPIAGADLVIETGFWYSREPRIPLWSFGICAFFALVVLLMRAGTPAAAAAGFAITSSLIFSTAPLPFMPLRTAFTPAFGVFALAYAATRFGYSGKLRLGTAEPRSGRSAPQVAANLGAAMLFALPFFQFLLINSNLIGPHLYSATALIPALIFAPALAALAEAAADTVSSEIGQSLTIAFNQKFGTRPRLITTLRIAQPGTNGAITLLGSLAGILAAFLIALAGTWALRGGITLLLFSTAGALFGLFFDSLLGATLERKGWLNNDAVNFLSTLSAALFVLLLLALIPHPYIG